MFQSLLIWGTYICGVLLFEWVLIFEKSVAIASMGTYICGVLVFDGYLYSREYGSLVILAQSFLLENNNQLLGRA